MKIVALIHKASEIEKISAHLGGGVEAPLERIGELLPWLEIEIKHLDSSENRARRNQRPERCVEESPEPLEVLRNRLAANSQTELQQSMTVCTTVTEQTCEPSCGREHLPQLGWFWSSIAQTLLSLTWQASNGLQERREQLHQANEPVPTR